MGTGMFSSPRKSSTLPEHSSPCYGERLSRRQFNKGLLQKSSVRLWSLCTRGQEALTIHGTLYRWARELNKELQSCYKLFTIGCCSGVASEHPSDVVLQSKGWNSTRHRAECKCSSVYPDFLKFWCSWFAQTFSRNRLFIHFTFFLVLSLFSATPALEEFYSLLRKSNSDAELCTAPGALCTPWAAASH